MRAVVAASFVVALTLASLAGASVPTLVYPAFEPSKPKGATWCYATGAPAPDGDQVNLFTVYNCGNSLGYTAYVGYMNLDGPTSQIILASPKSKNISYHAPVSVGNHRAYTWSTGDKAAYEINGLQRPNSDGGIGKVSWTVTGTGWSSSTPSYSKLFNLLYVAIDEDIKALNLDDGTQAWSSTFTGVYSISNVVYFEENNAVNGGSVFWVTDVKGTGVPKVHKMAASIHSNTPFSVDNPCNVTAAPNEQFQLQKINFGLDSNGPLNGLFMYGNYDPPAGHKFTTPKFMVCRFSHNSLQQEYSWGFSDSMDVHGVTGGDNATIFNVYNRGTNTYEVIILNQTKGNYERNTIARSVTDKDNNPVVIQGDAGLSPRIVMQRSLNGDKVVAYDTWWKYTKPAWARTFGCWLTATVARNSGVDRVFCMSDESDRSVTSMDYHGNPIWQQANIPSGYSAINMADIYVAFQLSFPIVGYSFDPTFTTPGPGDSAAGGPSGAVIALVIIIIIFLLVLGVILFRTWTQKSTRRTASRMQLDKEGYAGLNA